MSDAHWTWKTDQTFPSETGAGKRVLEEVLEQLERHSWFEQDIFGVRLAMEEAIVNAIKHGNRHDTDKNVRVECRLSPSRFWIQITDEGPGFNPEAVPDCTQEEYIERDCGRGIMLMRCFMTHVEYNQSGNTVVMEKHRNAEAAAE
jgi:serine/threonine-protein kinase RsbW